jgi:hypothetical protein
MSNPLSRRLFLQRTGIAAAALSVPSALLFEDGASGADPSAGASSPNATSSTHSIGGVSIGAGQNAVLAVLGQPTGISVVHGLGTPLWLYQGLMVAFWYPEGVGSSATVRHVIATSPAGGSTDSGVKCGDPATAMSNKYGSQMTMYDSNRYSVMVDANTQLDAWIEESTVSSLTLFTQACPTCTQSASLVGGTGAGKPTYVPSKSTTSAP